MNGEREPRPAENAACFHQPTWDAALAGASRETLEWGADLLGQILAFVEEHYDWWTAGLPDEDDEVLDRGDCWELVWLADARAWRQEAQRVTHAADADASAAVAASYTAATVCAAAACYDGGPEAAHAAEQKQAAEMSYHSEREHGDYSPEDEPDFRPSWQSPEEEP